MQPREKAAQLFEEIRNGNRSAMADFLEVVWTNSTRMAFDPEGAPMLEEALRWASEHATEHPRFHRDIVFTVGSLKFLGDHFEEAHVLLNEAQQLFIDAGEEDGLAATRIMSGFLHRSQGDIELALRLGLPAIEQLARTKNYPVVLIAGYYWIGGVYAETGHGDEAIAFFQRCLNLDYRKGVDPMAARLTNGIAGVYMKQKKFTLALENFQKAIDLCNTSDENAIESTFKPRALTDLGDYYLQTGDLDEAIRYNQEALVIRQQKGILNGSITNLLNLGTIYNRQSRTDDAITMLKQALKTAEEIQVKAKMYQIHELLSSIYLGTGDLKESLMHYRAFHEIREVVNHDDLERKVKNQVELFKAEETRKENAVIKSQKKEIEQKNRELQETIDELTITKISRKAKAFTLVIAIVLFLLEELILHFVLHFIDKDSFLLSIGTKLVIVLSLNPIEKIIEHYLLKRVIKIRKPIAET